MGGASRGTKEGMDRMARQTGIGEATVGAGLLVVDADAAHARALAEALQALSIYPSIATAGNGREALEILRRNGCEIVLADLASLSDIASSGEDAVARLVRVADGALVIALAEGDSVSAAVGAMRAGAHDYLAKPVNGELLRTRLWDLWQRHGRGPRPTAAPASPAPAGPDFGGFVGRSSAMQVVYEQIGRVAGSSAPVFITGESGTGKDVCAEALHAHGPRAGKRLVAVNCAAIPRDLMESELFGVARGAFTGAHEDRKGAAELADGGTLFLDEIGELDLSLQSKLLRFLQTGTLSRLGESGTRKVDVRVICATNRNPMQLIQERKFREDLFYRLHVLPIHLPPLRQRPSDVLPLARYFLAHYAREEHKSFTGFSREAEARLSAAEWPGNVRQLQNLVRRLVVMFDGGEIGHDMLDIADIESRRPASGGEPAPTVSRRAVQPMWQQEQRIIEEAIAAFGGNISLAAAALEISPSTIYRKRQSWAEMAMAG
ncbi:sigma-54-dependent transcriptional regulator [Devosia albogilva]|uniref:Sigma-54-dependent transcriptional regulator n=1 Tax=Devosia albogilva TaxID=429726 RepID=A0ABW5QLV9_9HYPH